MVVISASRRTDLPAFFPKETVEKINSMENVDCVVFWSKNPAPLLKYIDQLNVDWYLQYTLNDYPMYEKGIPELDERIETFKDISLGYGKDRVIWRYDPILISDTMSLDGVLEKIWTIAYRLNEYTNKLVFSYIDVYPKLNLPDCMRAPIFSERKTIEETLLFFNKTWGIELATCAEVGVSKGISKNKCIDPVLIKKITGKDVSNKKDTSQRLACGCAPSVDIGKYRTCRHNCTYCYAG